MQSIKTRDSSFIERHLGGTEFSGREIIRMLVPFYLDSLSIFFISMLITALISGNGEQSVAAVSLVSPILSLVSCMFNGIGAGGTVVVAQSCGSGDDNLIKRASVMVIWPTVGIGLIAVIPMLLFASPLLRVLYPSTEAAVLAKATTYLQGALISVIPFTVYTAVFSVLRGMGESKKCLVLSVIINVAYLIFSFIFLNFLNLDIKGSYLALIFARIAGMAAAVFALLRVRYGVRLSFNDLKVFDKELLIKTFKVSIPLSFEQILGSCGSIISQVYMSMLGTSALAANAVANSLLGILQVPANAAGALTVTVVGRCFGANKRKEARDYSYKCYLIGIILFTLTALVFYPLLPYIIRIYKPTADTASIAMKLLYLSIPMLMLFLPGTQVMPSALRCFVDNVFPSAFSLAVMWIINILGGYLLAIPAGLGLIGVWISSWAGWVIRALGYTWRFNHISKR